MIGCPGNWTSALEDGHMPRELGRCLGRPSLLPVPGPVLQVLLGDGSKVVLEKLKGGVDEAAFNEILDA